MDRSYEVHTLKPLPRHVQWWRRTRDRRQAAYTTFKAMGAKALILAISVLGATLVSYGAWMIYAPAGYIVGGLLCWVLLWSHEQDHGRTG
jgi:hypothetical protein